MRRILGAGAALALAGCEGLMYTHFEGAPKVKDGPAGCKAACAAWGMDLAGMVKMGEYSDGCICQVRPAPGAPAATPAQPSSDAAGVRSPGPQAIAGVWLQMQAAAAAASQQQQWSAGGPTQPPPQAPYVPGSPPGLP